ncbi:hypothetical protein BJF93_04660 [Xaviernesmea oryzae]|uniref:Acyltransferase 3 domain-containing protein n=1 Tax=Xaviernesmea oryzae TaxID=464029 RepID=A0A1Q9AUQ8_9HYPH|nr:hypothetical protein BJF93_04660 [Xaviernesmea oryzae]
MIIPAAVVELGAFGVDLFFVLSGFLMIFISRKYVSGEKPVSDFLIQRIFRVWPLYVIATALYLGLAIVSSLTKTGELPYDTAWWRLLSIFFIPSFDRTGVLQPIVGVGWTLNYEAFFYLVFSIALFFPGRFILPAVGGVLFAFFLAGCYVLPSGSAGHIFLSNPILFEFLFGAVIAAMHRGGFLRLNALYYLSAGFALLIAFAFVPNESVWRFIARGVPAALIFIGFLRLEERVTWSRLLVLLGDASYSIYLFHVVILYQVIGKLFPLIAKALPVLSGEVSALMASLVAIVIGTLIHLFVEKPILGFLGKR